MFPFKQSDEISFHISSSPQQEDFIQEGQIFLGHQASLEGGSVINFGNQGQLQPHQISGSSNMTDDPNFVTAEKKIARKEIERQRRQQMSNLQSSLRSLLPPSSLKGKRSTSDQIHEAFNYINHLKNNIHELSLKRDKLKMLFNPPLEHEKMAENTDHANMPNCVMVRPHLGGVEIIITSCGSQEDGVLLSRVLEEVLEAGLDVASCFSTRNDDRLYNTIQCQAALTQLMEVLIFHNAPDGIGQITLLHAWID